MHTSFFQELTAVSERLAHKMEKFPLAAYSPKWAAKAGQYTGLVMGYLAPGSQIVQYEAWESIPDREGSTRALEAKFWLVALYPGSRASLENRDPKHGHYGGVVLGVDGSMFGYTRKPEAVDNLLAAMVYHELGYISRDTLLYLVDTRSSFVASLLRDAEVTSDSYFDLVHALEERVKYVMGR